MKTCSAPLSLLAALLLLPTVTRAVENVRIKEASRSQEVDKLFAEWDKKDSPGCALAIIQDGKIVYERGYGQANLEYNAPIKPNTVFHIASTSKQFTAFAIHLLAQEGKLSLDDDVRKYLPELHDFGKPITIQHLLHHTSGLRDQWNLLMLAGWRMEDVITEDDILRLVWRQRELNFEPGSQFVYCNTGYTLLGLIVKRVGGKSLPDFCRERIFEPLGMKDTHFHDDCHRIVPGRAYSYDAKEEGGWENSVLSFSNVGATSLFTTVEDLAKWDANFYDKKIGGAALLAAMQVTGKLNDGKDTNYGSGLVLGRYRGLPIVEHNGVDAGFRATLLRFPEQKFSVVLLANLSGFEPVRMARKVADLYLADKLKPVVAVQGRGPQAQPARRNGRGLSVTKAPTAETFATYVGDYYSEELGVVYTVFVKDGALFLRHPRRDVQLRPIAEDQFNGMGQIHFLRGTDGHPNALTISNGRVINLRFARVEIKPVMP